MFGHHSRIYNNLRCGLLKTYYNRILTTPNVGQQCMALYYNQSMFTTEKKSVAMKQQSPKVSQANDPTQQQDDGKFRRQPTHFLSFPIASPPITEKLSSLLLSSSSLTSTLDAKIFISDRNLHITIGVLHLPTSDDIQHASNIIMDHCSSLDQHEPLHIDVHSLDIMQNNPRMAHVLYAKVRNRSKQRSLHDLCESLRQKMMNHGYMNQDHRPLKLHVTLMNTIYGTKSAPTLTPALPSSSSSTDRTTTTKRPMKVMKRRRKPFDATTILETLGDTHWGTLRLDTLHLMKMGRTGPMKTYESVSSFKI